MTLAMNNVNRLASTSRKDTCTSGRAVEVAEARLTLARLKIFADRPAWLGGSCDECKRGVAKPAEVLAVWRGEDGCGDGQRDGFWVYGAEGAR